MEQVAMSFSCNPKLMCFNLFLILSSSKLKRWVKKETNGCRWSLYGVMEVGIKMERLTKKVQG